MPRKFRRVLRKGYSKSKAAKAQYFHHIDEAESSDDGEIAISTDNRIQFTEVSTQTDLSTIHSSIEVSTQTDLSTICISEASIQTDLSMFNVCAATTQTEETTHCSTTSQPGKFLTDSCIFKHMLCNLDEEGHEKAVSDVGTSLNWCIECEGNCDEKFSPLVEKYKGVFRDASGI